MAYSNQQIIDTYNSLKAQGLDDAAIKAAASRNPALGLSAAEIDAALATLNVPAPQNYGDIQVPGTGKTVRDAVAQINAQNTGPGPVTHYTDTLLDRDVGFFEDNVLQTLDDRANAYLLDQARRRDAADAPDLQMLAWQLNNPMPNFAGIKDARERTLALNNWQASNPQYVDPSKYGTFDEYAAAVQQRTGVGADKLDRNSLITSYFGPAAMVNPDAFSTQPPIILDTMDPSTVQYTRASQQAAKLRGDPFWGVGANGQMTRNAGDPSRIGQYVQSVGPDNQFTTPMASIQFMNRTPAQSGGSVSGAPAGSSPGVSAWFQGGTGGQQSTVPGLGGGQPQGIGSVQTVGAQQRAIQPYSGDYESSLIQSLRAGSPERISNPGFRMYANQQNGAPVSFTPQTPKPIEPIKPNVVVPKVGDEPTMITPPSNSVSEGVTPSVADLADMINVPQTSTVNPIALPDSEISGSVDLLDFLRMPGDPYGTPARPGRTIGEMNELVLP